MAKFRKRPVVIEAIQWTGTEESLDAIILLSVASDRDVLEADNGKDLAIPTLEGVMIANLNDWIIRGVDNEIYPCKPDIFKKTYVEVLPIDPDFLASRLPPKPFPGDDA